MQSAAEAPIAQPGPSRLSKPTRRELPACRLDALSERGQITDREWVAGMRLRRLWHDAQALPQTSLERMELVGRVDAASLQFLVHRSSERWCAVFVVAVWDASVSGFYCELRDGLRLLATIWGIPRDFARAD